jgi:hypothetical protein
MTRLSLTGRLVALGVVGIVVLFLVCSGGVFVAQVPFYLAVGWASFLARVLPELRPDPDTVATAVVCLAAVTFGCHWFGRWLWGNLRPDRPAWSWRWTGRVVAVIVLLFVAGTAAVGIVHQTLWLTTAKEPLVEGGIRQVAAQYSSANHMKQMGNAVHDHFDAVNVLPVSTFAADGRPMHSWQTALLPYIEEDGLYKQIDVSKSWNHRANRSAVGTTVKVFLHPAVEADRIAAGFAASHYAANVLTFGGDKARKLSDYTAGTSNTIIIGEAVQNSRAWADPLNWRDPRLGLGHPYGFGGPTSQKGTQFCFADGSVRTVDLSELTDLLK